MFARYLKECLLKGKQTLAHVSDPLKKLTIGGKIEPLGFQRVEFKNGHIRVTWLKHFIMSSRTEKCQTQHVLLHLKEHGDHPIRTK